MIADGAVVRNEPHTRTHRKPLRRIWREDVSVWVGSSGQRRTASSCRVERREGCRGNASGNADGLRLMVSFLVRTRDVLHVASLTVPQTASAVHVDMGATGVAETRFQLQLELSTFALRIPDMRLEGVVSAGGREENTI